MIPLRPLILTLGGLRATLVLTKHRSVLRMLWTGRASAISELLTGDTDQDDEDKVLSLLRDSASADELAWIIRNINAGEIPIVGTLSGEWWLLDDELERSAVTSIASRLVPLFDRRDYWPWRLIRGSLASQIRSYDRAPVRFLLNDIPHQRWRLLVADLALRGRRAEGIGALDGLDGDHDRAGLAELDRVAQQLSGDDARAVRGLHGFCDYVDRAFRDVAALDADGLVRTIERILDENDPAVRNAGLDALGFLAQTTAEALRVAARALDEHVAEATLLFIRGLLQQAADAPTASGGIQQALQALREELAGARRRLDELRGALQGLATAVDALNIFSSSDDDRAVAAVRALRGGNDPPLQWLPTEWKITMGHAMLNFDTTADDDEEAILDILRTARTGAELFQIYAGLGHEGLEDNIHGTENDQLYALVNDKLAAFTAN